MSEATPEVIESETSEVQQPDPQDLRGLLNHALEESERPPEEKTEQKDDRARDEHGRFVKKEAAPEDGSAEKESESPEGATADAETKPLEAPATWKTEAKQLFASLPAEAQAEILRREKEVAQGFTAKDSEIKQAKAFSEALEPVIGPHRQFLEQTAGSVQDGVKNILNWAAFAGQNPVQFIQQFAQQRGIDLTTMEQQRQEVDPQFAQLQQVIQGLQSEISTLKGHTQQQQQRTVQSEIQAFADEKDGGGNPLRPHFESVRSEVFELIPVIKSRNPDWSVRQVLSEAYNKATRLNDDVFSQITANQQEKERLEREARERAEKAKLAKKSVSGSPPVGETKQPGPANVEDLRATLVSGWNSLSGDARV